jgi:hypothetical protein
VEVRETTVGEQYHEHGKEADSPSGDDGDR